ADLRHRRAVDGVGLSLCVIVWGCAIENKSSLQTRPARRKKEGFVSSPAETADRYLTVGSGQVYNIVSHRIQVGGNLIGWQGANRLSYRIIPRRGNFRCTSAIRPHSGKQVWSDRNVTSFGKFIGELLHPIGHAKNFVDYNDCRSLFLNLWID